MWTSRFDPKQRAIIVPVQIQGPLGVARLQCLLDTGTTATVIDTAALDQIGYSARMGKSRSRLVALGTQEGYRLEVTRLDTMGFTAAPCEVLCHDFAETLGIDGLIGIDLLVGRLVLIDGAQGLLSVGP
jgi:Fe2+ transport system protein FeoA